MSDAERDGPRGCVPYGHPEPGSCGGYYIYPLDSPNEPDQSAEEVLATALWEAAYWGEHLTCHHAATLAGAAIDALHDAGYTIVATR